MTGRPLRKVLALWLAASLAAPAGAVDVKVPVVEGKTSGSGVGGAVGGVSGAGPGMMGLTPQLNLDLGGSIKAVPGAPTPVLNAATPLLAPAAADLTPGSPALAAPSAAQLKSALNPPPAYTGHNPEKPVFWPANAHALIHEPADKLSPATLKGIAAEYEKAKSAHVALAEAQHLAGKDANPAKVFEGGVMHTKVLIFDEINSAPFTASALGKPTFGKKGLPPASPKPTVPVVAAAADGPAVTGVVALDAVSLAPADGPGVVEFKPFEAGPAALAPPPPSPPLTQKIGAWFSGQWAKLTGASAKQGLAAQPPPAARLERIVSSARAPLLPETKPFLVTAPEALETEDGLLVHSPRAVRRDALSYRVHFLGLAQADGAVSTADTPVRVKLARSGDEAQTAALRERSDAFDRLIENNFAALELMARSAGKITVKTARALFVYVEAMSADYAKLAQKKEYGDVMGDLASIGVGFEMGIKEAGLSDADYLPAELLALVTPLDSTSVHSLINRIHQGALDNLGRTGDAPANLQVTLNDGTSQRRLDIVDTSVNPIAGDGRIVSRGLKALVAAVMRSKDTPKGALMIRDHQFKGHFKLGAHSAEIYANFLPPDEGGIIRVRYQEWGTSFDNQTRLYYVARLLQKTGFHVEQNEGFLTAVVDKDHAAQSVDKMTDTFALVVQALHATVGVDFALPMLVEGAKDSAEVGRRIDGWVDIVLGEGTLPFYIHDEHAQMIEGWRTYVGLEGARAKLRAALDVRLEALGLPPIPAGEPMGQRTVDRFVSEAVEKALARGQLRLAREGRLVKVSDYDAVTPLAKQLEAGQLNAARMGEVVSSLDPTLLDYETVGSLGALTVERAQRRLDSDSWLTVHVLRDPKTGQIGFARAELTKLELGALPRPLSPANLFAALAQQGHPVAPFTPSEVPPGRGHFMRLLKAEPESEPADRLRFLGLPASPAHGRPVVARVTYDKAKAAQGGYIFMAPYTTPDDLDAIKGAKAVLTTSGGLLSHAAITTREMGIPAAILMGVTWQGGVAALETRAFGPRAAMGELAGRQVRAVSRVALPEGAVVRLDPGTGALEAFPGGSSAALLDAAGALERYDAGRDGSALAAWLLKRVGGPSLTPEQKQVLIQETLSGLASRALERPEAASALASARAALREAGASAQADRVGERVFAALGEKVLSDVAEARTQIARAQSVEAVDRAARRAAALAERLAAAAGALGRPKSELARLGVMASGAAQDAATRTAALIAEDVAELQEHARLYPSATLESLPRMKAAIAKAKRRKLVPELVGRWEAQVRALEATREAAMRAEKPLVLPLSGIIDADVGAVGGKGAKLGEIAAVVAAAGGVVPKGVALTVHAYRAFLVEAGIAERLEALGSDRSLSPDQRSARAKRLILSAKLSAGSGVGRAILAALREQGLDAAMLAVRSSAVDEDGAEAAFAGAGDTHLYVAPDEVLANVLDIWASLWNPRALLYRQSKGLSTANMAQAVVLQEMVDAQIAGVAFTQDPVSGDTSRLIVNSAFGLGEGVVSNRVSPDQYVVGKDVGVEILPPLIGDKKLAVVRAPGGKGTVERKMPPEWRRRRSMTPEKLAKLNAVALALERHFGFALDLEYAFVDSTLYILQARPVTIAASATASAKAKNLLFVCTGNTCRSPMAEQFARSRLLKEGREDVAVKSRGLVVAEEGQGMSPEAVATLAERGLDGRLHSAQSLTPADVAEADVILAMTALQAQAVLKAHPGAKGKVFTLAEYAGRGVDVSDPFGRDIAAYRAAADAIEDAVSAAVSR